MVRSPRQGADYWRYLDHGDEPDQNLIKALSQESLRVGVTPVAELVVQMAVVRAVC